MIIFPPKAIILRMKNHNYDKIKSFIIASEPAQSLLSQLFLKGQKSISCITTPDVIIYAQSVHAEDSWSQILNYEDIQEYLPQSQGAEVHSCWPGIWYMVTLWLSIPRSRKGQPPTGMRRELRNKNEILPCGEMIPVWQHFIYENQTSSVKIIVSTSLLLSLYSPPRSKHVLWFCYLKNNHQTFLPFLRIWKGSKNLPLGELIFPPVDLFLDSSSLYNRFNIIQIRVSLHFPKSVKLTIHSRP